MKLLLHIGTMRTGSTSIQFFIKKNWDLLLKYGILFPNTAMNSNAFGRHGRSSGHQGLLTALKSKNFELFELLKQEIKQHNHIETILISCENFSLLQSDLITELKKQLDIFENYKVIVYLRRQDSYLESIYGEFISGGWHKLTVDPQAFFQHNLEGKGQVECNYNHLLRPWAETFGKENIIVRPFEKEQWKDSDLIKDFFYTTGMMWDDNYEYPDKKIMNVAVSAQANQIIRYLNYIPMEGTYYRAVLANLFAHEEKQTLKKAKTPWVSPALRHKVMQHCNGSNSTVAKDYLNCPDGCLFYEPLPPEDTPWNPVQIQDVDLWAKTTSLFLEQKAIETNKKFSDIKKIYTEQNNRIEEQNISIQKQIHQKASLNKQMVDIVLECYNYSRSNLFKRLYRFLRYPILREVKILRQSGLFDQYYYYKNYPHTIGAGITAIEHYVRYGVQEGNNPSKNFNTVQYLIQNPSLIYTGLNPLVHFVLK